MLQFELVMGYGDRAGTCVRLEVFMAVEVQIVSSGLWHHVIILMVTFL
jgi:hypothetical protein